jgi:hypothetical protein
MLGGSGYAAVTATGDGNSFTGSTDANGNNIVIATGDDNTLTGMAAGVNFTAIGNDNSLIAGSSFNTLEADGSDNTLQGGSGSSTLIASAGTDSLGENNVLIAGIGYTEMIAAGDYDTLTGGSGTNSLTATGDNNILTAGTSFAVLSATGDGNTLTGGSGVNTLTVNGDNNLLYGGSVYEEVDITGNGNQFQAGAGNGDLSINGNDNHITGSDNAYWSAVVAGSGNSLTAGQNTTGVTVETLGNSYSAGNGYMVLDYRYIQDATINLANGTATAAGTSAADTIAPSVTEVHVGFNATVTAGAAPVLLEALGNGNTLTGGAGNDDLIADGIYNTLVGGAGTNTLSATEGNNVFLLDGTGSAIVQNGSANGVGPVNQMQFINGVTGQNLWFAQSGEDLDITEIGTSHTIDLQNWFAGSDYQLGAFQGADGLTLNNSDVNQLVTAMASYQAAHNSFNAASASVMPADTALQNSLAAVWHS